MTEWTIAGGTARARCHGHDLEARWGNGSDYDRISAERESANPGADRPETGEEGIIVRIRSEPKGVDNIRMLVAGNQGTADETLRNFTADITPESLIPEHEDWRDEWSWLARYRDRAKWNRMGGQATAFMGPLTLTVRMTTMEEALRRTTELTQAEGGESPSSISSGEGFKRLKGDTPVLTVELREDLNLIAYTINRASSEGVSSLREYTRMNDPAVVVTRCLLDIHQQEEPRD